MSETLGFDLTANDAAQVRELAERCLTAIRESNERARQTGDEIAELQTETRDLLSQLKKRLDVETDR